MGETGLEYPSDLQIFLFLNLGMLGICARKIVTVLLLKALPIGEILYFLKRLHTTQTSSG